MHPTLITRGKTRLSIKLKLTDEAASYIQSVTKRVLTDYEYNIRLKRYISTKHYCKYNKELETLYLPINLMNDITILLSDIGYDYTVQEELGYELRNLTIKMKDSFIPRPHQVSVIDYLRQEQPYRKGLAIQTGSGKTVSSIAGMIAYGKCGMIIVSGLCDQWVKSIKQFTTAKNNQICLIQGFDSLFEVLNSDNKPEIFVFSLETLRAYCQRQGHYAEIPSFAEFVQYFGIGYKIMDEVHKNFHACTMIDLSCNIPNNVYLTATFTSGNPGTRKIFNIIYPEEMRFGNKVLEKYTDAYCYLYRGNVPENKCVRARGYMHIKYEDYLLKRPMYLKEFFEYTLSPIVYSHYINRRQPGQRLAVFFATLKMINAAYDWFKTQFPNLKITKYIGGTSDNVLTKNDIIITTLKSMSCGTDVKGLTCVINTVSIKAPTAVLQLFGRLRKIENVQTEYADICDMNLKSHQRHRFEREHWLESVCKSYKVLNL